MKMIGRQYNLLLLVLCTLISFISSEFDVQALPYDYSASIECLANPHKPKYGGGIIMNPEFDNGLRGWSSFGNAKLQHRKLQGNKFLSAQSRSQPHDSMSQKVYLQADKLYTFSAWIQASGGNSVAVAAMFKTASGFVRAGEIIAESSCWSMLKGGLTVEASGNAELYFESKNTSVEIWVDSISLQPFTKQQWKSHQDQSIAENRKSKVRIQAVDARGNPLPNATISIEQKYPSFPFGCAITKLILDNPAHQKWFTSRFRVTTFGDEMKWYSTENVQGHEDYSVADGMLQFTQQNNIAVRGHNVFWDDPQYQLGWVKALNQQQLESATNKRLNSIMQRYKGKVIAWDVVNENLHFNFFESKMGPNASAIFYNWAIKADAETPLFLNDYNTIEETRDEVSSPAKYLQKLREIQSFPGNEGGRYGIGLESHFATTPNIPYIRASLDTLGAAKVPIWITELDVSSKLNQPLYLEQLLRELHSHPQIQGIIMWAGRGPQGCYQMCLTDENFNNLPTGDVVDKLLREWGYWATSESFRTDSNGYFVASLPHGDYDVKISSNSSDVDSSRLHKLNVISTTRSLKLSV
ncbi:endo-1,4-beta-xylanase 5-like [Argentina anserina]|uniref:endo-1,4-beta-xylanase 5-like n=1 Tax=Argentina anserina TaxID=57926 RepID=UPI002176335C|nr:endo-1,4-beta-xylanase 5-like [Potentilla anserina]